MTVSLRFWPVSERMTWVWRCQESKRCASTGERYLRSRYGDLS